MNLGIIGLPQVGKKNVFSLLTGLEHDRAPKRAGIAYGVAMVRDPRVDRLSAMFNPKRNRYAEFEVALPPDVTVQGARSAEWLGPLRNADACIHVVRAFESASVFHVEGSVDPERDLGLVEMELLVSDLDLVEKRLERMVKEKATNQAMRDREKAILERCKAHLEAEQSLRTLGLSGEDLKAVSGLQFLTLKPLVVVFNVGEDLAGARAEMADLAERVRRQGATVLFLSAAIEAELSELESAEQAAFMADLGLTEPAAHRLSRAAFECLGLLSFFTVGEDEVRAWPVRVGALAPEAAGKIHTDLERGFIRAEVTSYEDLVAAGSEKAAKEANQTHVHGKDYEVKDGDVLHIRFSV